MEKVLILVLITQLFLGSTKEIKKFSLSETITNRFNQGLTLNTYATKSGDTSFNLTYYQRYGVEVDLEDHSGDASDSTYGPGTVNMQIGLYTSNTLLSTNCLEFLPYQCSVYSCQILNRTAMNTTFPYFTAIGYPVSANIYLDYQHWRLRTSLTVADYCLASYSSYGQSTYGILGLGITGEAANNFDQGTVFSIYLEEDGKSGELIFSYDDSRADADAPSTVLVTDTDWHTNISFVQIGQTVVSATSVGLFFDLNFNYIGFPQNLFKQIVATFNNVTGLNCSTTSTYTPQCNYIGDIDSLPSIFLSTLDSTISIPPQTYISNLYGYVTLNLIALDNSQYSSSYVTLEYSNNIVLGSIYMVPNYIVFEAPSGILTISIYPVKRPVSKIPYIVGGVLLGMVLFCCGCCYCYRRRIKRYWRQDRRPGRSTRCNSLDNSLVEG